MFHAQIELVQGVQGPFYPEGTQELKLEKIVVTEQGTEGRLPIVDFVMKGQHGEKYMLCISGRNCEALSAVIRGANMRNHGNPTP